MEIGTGAPSPPPATASAPSASAEPEHVESRFKQALSALGGEIDRGEKTVKRALNGAQMGGLAAGDLIALQAGIYRYSEAVDLAGKLVDRAGSAVKTTLQSNG
ncbi:MAG: hypothetical protein H6718_31915 [Polyangiaceae bacterium]|nr:hypothetical protein [Polyangiaceae bacterium]